MKTFILVLALSFGALFAKNMNALAETYVKLSLAVGQHDAYFVDAYYGPQDWQEKAKKQKVPIEQLETEVRALLEQFQALQVGADDFELRRKQYLEKQTIAMLTRIRMLRGETFTFDEESRLLYDAVSPTYPQSYYEEKLKRLDHALGGRGTLKDRMESFMAQFVIPADTLDSVFQEAISYARKVTGKHLTLPETENFEVEYVKGQPWAAYNWYKGNYFSLIQVNSDMEIFIDRAVDLACHEGYPGHHVYNALLEKNLVQDRNMVEFSVYPLFSPQSLIAEGTANYGIEMVFSPKARVAFEKVKLFPLAGIDYHLAERYYEIQGLKQRLTYAGNDVARNYLDGKLSEAEALDQLQRYLLMSPKSAKQRLDFVIRYRSYVINYNLGLDLVRSYMVARAGDSSQKRWEVFTDLLSTPQIPSLLNMEGTDTP